MHSSTGKNGSGPAIFAGLRQDLIQLAGICRKEMQLQGHNCIDIA
jgi:hypothetical protein